MKDFELLKNRSILAMSNLLSANIDCGLLHSLEMAYHEDNKARTAFMQVLTNILNQGAEFEGLSNNYVMDRYNKLVDILYEPNLSVVVAMVDSCPLSEMDDLAFILLIIFEARNQIFRLLGDLIEREILRTGTYYFV
jgi:hypothetical protein